MICGICRRPIAIGILLTRAQGLAILAEFRAHAARALGVEEQELDSVEHWRVMKNAPAFVCQPCYTQLFKKADWLPDAVHVEKWSLEGRVPVHAPQLIFQSRMPPLAAFTPRRPK